MSDTPMTDAEWVAHGFANMQEGELINYVQMDFACELERKLAAMTAAKNKALEALKEDRTLLDAMGDCLNSSMADSRIEKLNALIAELEEVRS